MEPSTNLLATSTHSRQPVRGFTLVEMLVSLGIILVITSVVILGQNSFNRSLVLVDTAYTIAATVRQAQAYGLSSRRSGTTQNAGYGIHLVSGVKTVYTLFADTDPLAPGNAQSGKCPGHTITTGLEARPGDCLYKVGSELVTDYSLNKGFQIASFCGYDTASPAQKRCSETYLSALDITFLRPSTQATIVGVRTTGVLVELTSASIRVTSPDGTQERCVNISKVGQVAVGTCP